MKPRLFLIILGWGLCSFLWLPETPDNDIYSQTELHSSSDTPSLISKILTDPVVEIVSPENGYTLVEGESLPIIIQASDPGGSISMIKIINGYLTRDTVYTPQFEDIYQYDWENMEWGEYEIFAIAEDDEGNTTVSDTIMLTVLDIPEVTIDEPKVDAELIEGQTIIYSATVIDNDSELENISYYANQKLIQR